MISTHTNSLVWIDPTCLKILPPSYNYPYNLQADEISIKESSVHSAALREITKALRTLRLCEK